jgi:hypothetical protein
MKQLASKITGKISMAAALLLAAGALAQDTESFTDSVSGTTDWAKQLTFTQFDPALGALTGITLDLSATFSSTFTITNTGGSTYGPGSTARRNMEIFLGSSAVDLAVGANNPNLPGNPWLNLLSGPLSIANLAPGANVSGTKTGSDLDETASYSDPTTLGDFTGLGTTLIDFYTQSGFTMTIYNGSDYDSSQNTSATLTGTITYDYTPAPIPEPATMAMFGIGLCSLALIRRRRSA